MEDNYLMKFLFPTDLKKAEERAYTNDNTHTTFSPQGWEGFDNNSPYTQAGFYNTTPVDPLSPTLEGVTFSDNKFFGLQETENQVQFQEQFLDISTLPVVIGDLMSEQGRDPRPWPAAAQPEWSNAQDTLYTKHYTTTTPNTTTMPFIDQEDSLDSKYVSVMPREVENNDVVISDYIVKDIEMSPKGVIHDTEIQNRVRGLSVDVGARNADWPNDIISTPEVLSYVEQLEKGESPQEMVSCNTTFIQNNSSIHQNSENDLFFMLLQKTKQLWPVQEAPPEIIETCTKMDLPSPPAYEPITPKSESHAESDHDDRKSHSSKRRRHDSEDSDETYTPYAEETPRKYKRRKPNVPIKDMILALEGSQQLTKARRGRPPKRRESTVSSVCSVDDNSSNISTNDMKYRELRDKNNEASKRSRLNRKLKELQMEQLADELEEKNKKLKVKADILEDMTKRLKDALMTAILQK